MKTSDMIEALYREMISRFVNMEMKEYVSIARITLPKFLHKLEEKLRGGFPIGYIINIMAASGAGKSTYIDAMILHWIMNTEYKVGVVSLEASEGE